MPPDGQRAFARHHPQRCKLCELPVLKRVVEQCHGDAPEEQTTDKDEMPATLCPEPRPAINVDPFHSRSRNLTGRLTPRFRRAPVSLTVGGTAQ